jgi:hypothetical protein
VPRTKVNLENFITRLKAIPNRDISVESDIKETSRESRNSSQGKLQAIEEYVLVMKTFLLALLTNAQVGMNGSRPSKNSLTRHKG